LMLTPFKGTRFPWQKSPPASGLVMVALLFRLLFPNIS
jgi:hypothetical protein